VGNGSIRSPHGRECLSTAGGTGLTGGTPRTLIGWMAATGKPLLALQSRGVGGIRRRWPYAIDGKEYLGWLGFALFTVACP